MGNGAKAPLCVVFNVASGSGRAEEVRQALQRGCAADGRKLHLLEVQDPRELPGRARQAVTQAQAEQGVVVAAGGDGTINAVAQAALGSGCLFGVLPQGTFNYFGRTHHIPEETQAAVDVLLTGRPRPVQVGLVGDRVFLVNASLGLYPRLLEEREGWKRQFGRSRLVALGAGVVTILRGHRSLRLSVQTRGEVRQLRTPTLFVGNNALQLAQVGMPEALAVEAGELAAIALKPVGRWRMLSLLVRGAFGRLGDADELLHVATQELTVAPGRRQGIWGGGHIKVATDGEILRMRLPLTFKVAPQALQLLCPRETGP